MEKMWQCSYGTVLPAIHALSSEKRRAIEDYFCQAHLKLSAPVAKWVDEAEMSLPIATQSFSSPIGLWRECSIASMAPCCHACMPLWCWKAGQLFV